MNKAFVKLRQRQAGKYRKMLSTGEQIYPAKAEIINVEEAYCAGASLPAGEWFYIEELSKQEYSLNEIIGADLDSVDFDALDKADFVKIDFIFVKNGSEIYFQNIPKSRLARKKKFYQFGEGFEYDGDAKEIIINEYPDAIYDTETDKLYFHRLESITGIFKGIDQLYREATETEVDEFLENDFITLKEGYSSTNIKTANRKRIALALETLSKLSPSDKTNIFEYITEYCPELKTDENKFAVGSEDEMKSLLYGIEQRFYTTVVGGEQRIAQAVTKVNGGRE